jgi:hypothetical protein
VRVDVLLASGLPTLPTGAILPLRRARLNEGGTCANRLICVATLATLALVSAACSKAVSAKDVCEALQGAGVAANCHRTTPQGLQARALDAYEFF